MKQRLWMVAALVVGAAPVWAQPDNKGAMAPSDEVAVAELERAIGGRTTLELKFKNLTSEEVTDEVAKSSGLPFVAPPSNRNRGAFPNPPVAPAGNAVEAPTWNGDVDKTDFWLALRQWGRAENVRLQRERKAVEERQKTEVAPQPPAPVAGQTARDPAAMAEFWQRQSAWSQRRVAGLNRFNPEGTLSAFYRADAEAWNLVPNSELLVGDALNIWPCLVLATRFQRQQTFSIQKSEAPEKTDTETIDDKAGPNRAPLSNSYGEVATEGGLLRDTLSLNLEVYMEPKLLKRAKVSVRMNQARDDAGEDLLLDSDNRPRVGSFVGSYSPYSGQDSRMTQRIELRPRQAKGRKLAVLSGVIVIRYPLKLQEHEISNFDGSQNFSLPTTDLPVEAQLDPPQVKNGMLYFSTSVNMASNRGAKRLLDNLNARRRRESQNNVTRATGAALNISMGAGGDIANGWGVSQSPLGQLLLPSRYTFIDSQGRTWIGTSGGLNVSLSGPDGKPVPVTSPPTPPPDNFIYIEKQSGYLHLVTENDLPNPNGQPVKLTPEELADIRFVKAIFTTESDWRTLEVPFEFHDLPLPPR